MGYVSPVCLSNLLAGSAVTRWCQAGGALKVESVVPLASPEACGIIMDAGCACPCRLGARSRIQVPPGTIYPGSAIIGIKAESQAFEVAGSLCTCYEYLRVHASTAYGHVLIASPISTTRQAPDRHTEDPWTMMNGLSVVLAQAAREAGGDGRRPGSGSSGMVFRHLMLWAI